MQFPGFVASRYLRPRRGRGVLSVVAAIAIVGFAAGVGALILALAITNGFRDAVQSELVGATAQVNLMPRLSTNIPDYPSLLAKVQALPHVEAVAPVIYTGALVTYGDHSQEIVLKGILPDQETRIGNLLDHLAAGSLTALRQDPRARNLIVGQALADSLGVAPGSWVQLYVPDCDLTPLGMSGCRLTFQIAGVYRSGYRDLESTWAFTSFQASQALHPQNQGNWASDLEFRLDNIYQATAVAAAAEAVAGPAYTTQTWISQNRPIFQALQLERLGTLIVIGLVVLVAALNVLIMLSMLVLEKRKEIAVLLSLGARRGQIRRIFVLQGVWIAALGTAAGLGLAYPLAWAANHFEWIHVSQDVYPVSYIPFHAHARDGLIVAVLALTVAWLATLYPSQRAVRVLPAETLRYE
ncbi:MAG: FtsX-like permease family protein [Terriglobales bacterium]